MPSAFFITDCFLYLDLLLKKRLFKPAAGETRTDLAAKEGVKGKRLLGALRTLWRSSPEGAHDARLQELKKFIQASPKKVPVFGLQQVPDVWCFGAYIFFSRKKIYTRTIQNCPFESVPFLGVKAALKQPSSDSEKPVDGDDAAGVLGQSQICSENNQRSKKNGYVALKGNAWFYTNIHGHHDLQPGSDDDHDDSSTADGAAEPSQETGTAVEASQESAASAVADAGDSDTDSDQPIADGACHADADDGPKRASDSEQSGIETDSDGDSILSKRTLFLGEQPSPSTDLDSSDHEPCSQVSDGWLGRAYNAASRERKQSEAKELAKKKLTQVCVHSKWETLGWL